MKKFSTAPDLPSRLTQVTGNVSTQDKGSLPVIGGPTKVICGLSLVLCCISILYGHFISDGVRSQFTPVEFRSQVVLRTTDHLEAARREAASHAEQQVARLLASMNRRAQEAFAPWMYSYGQSVRLDVERNAPLGAGYWDLTLDSEADSFSFSDIALVEARYREVVATQQHFFNMLGLIQKRARERYHQDVIQHIAMLREEFDVPDPGLRRHEPADLTEAGDETSSGWDQHAWAAAYFQRLEAAAQNSKSKTIQANQSGTPHGVYEEAFLASFPRMTQSAEEDVPSSIAGAITAAESTPTVVTSTAALVVTWYASSLDGENEQGVEKLAQLLDKHFDAMLDLILQDPEQRLVSALTSQHSELLEAAEDP